MYTILEEVTWKERIALRGTFVGRAKQHLINNPHARQKLAKSFGKSIEKASGEELSYLFEVLTDEIYEKEYLNYTSNNKMDAYFFVLTMMAYYWKTLEQEELVRMEDELSSLYKGATNTTKKKLRSLMSESFGGNGSFQRKLASITKLIKNFNNIDYLHLLNDLCSWNYCNEQGNISITCQIWSKTIFLTTKEEEEDF